MRGEETEYVLGTHDEELVRLGFQHRVWSQQAFALWERAGIAPGQTVLDVGCGPGFATLDLAGIVGSDGRVIAVDASARFLNHLKEQLSAQKISNVAPLQRDVRDMRLDADSVDRAFARWVLCFVEEPERVVSEVVRALRPGGVWAVSDYFNYRAITLAPRSTIFERVIEAVQESWRAHGGDPDIVGRLPAMMEACGMKVQEIRPLLRVARPGSALWQWPTTFFRNFNPRLVAEGFLTSSEQEEFDQDWQRRSDDPATFLCTPPVFDLIAVRPTTRTRTQRAGTARTGA